MLGVKLWLGTATAGVKPWLGTATAGRETVAWIFCVNASLVRAATQKVENAVSREVLQKEKKVATW